MVARGRAPVPDSSGKYDKKEEMDRSERRRLPAIGPLFLGALGLRGTRARGGTTPPAARAPNSRGGIAFGTQRHRRPNKKISRFSSLPAGKEKSPRLTAPRTRSCCAWRRGPRHQAPAGGSRPPRSYGTVLAAAHPLRGPGTQYTPVLGCVVEAAATAASGGAVACCDTEGPRHQPQPRRPPVAYWL
jgi:hypothetical protein